MLKLINKQVTPPGGFRYVCPETNYPFVADCMQDLLTKVKGHMKANDLPVPDDLSAKIENALCHLMPPGVCESTEGKRFAGGLSRHTPDILLNNTVTMNRRGAVVNADEAARRAAICVSCEHNANRYGCGSCRGITSTLKAIQNGRKTPDDAKLHVCDLCGIFLKVLVHVKDPGVMKNKTGLPIRCWLK